MIYYKTGYKYQLAQDYELSISPIKPKEFLFSDFIRLDTDGTLYIMDGYAWDGPSGPAIDTSNFMRGSLVHDALYQLLREGKLDHDVCREPADRLLQQICIEDGMSSLRAWWVYQGVRFGGGPSADPENDNPTITAP